MHDLWGGGEGSLPFAAGLHSCHRPPEGLTDNGEVAIQSCAPLVKTRLLQKLVMYGEDGRECIAKRDTHIYISLAPQ